MNKIEIYKQALKDCNMLIDKFNDLEDKSLNSIKKAFDNQIECDQIYCIIKQGIINAYLQTDTQGNNYLTDTFNIETDNYIEPFVTKKEIELLVIKLKNLSSNCL